MLSFSDWSYIINEEVNDHQLTSVTIQAASAETAKEQLAVLVPEHYASPDRIAEVLRKLGKPAVATLVETLLPQKSSLRSGDLGEIIATEYIEELTQYSVPIRRLRWKDHREMAMRGDDAIGVKVPGANSPIDFLKVEAKSRAALQTSVVTEAREALNGSDGLPTSHALNFVSQRCHEIGNTEVADAIDHAALVDGIVPQQVRHMLFTFSGNKPISFLKQDLDGYLGGISQLSVGVQVEQHQQFIAGVFDEALDANES